MRQDWGCGSPALFDGTVAEMHGACAPVLCWQNRPAHSPPREPTARRDYVRHWTPVHLDFVVESLEPAIERALGAGAELEDWP
jgi:hypothetical protein